MLKIFFLIFVLATPLYAYINTYSGCSGVPNNQPIIDISPKLESSVENGKKYIIKSPENNTHLTILALKGSWYEIGYAYGELMESEIHESVNEIFNYLINVDNSWIQLVKESFPIYIRWIPDILSMKPRELLMALLDLEIEFTKFFTPSRYTDQLKGMADASGIDLRNLTRANLIPELSKAHCSMAGIWGPASLNGKLLQLRALDWDYLNPISNYPLAAIYFPKEEGSNPFATYGFTSIVGAISGYSTKIAISEKVWNPPLFDLQSNIGEPFAYILRDLLQFGNDLESTVGMVYEAPRTCRIHVGIGSRADNSFEGLQISYNELNIFNDVNFTEYSDAHPQMNGIMYFDKHIGSKDACLGSIFKENYGEIDAKFLFQQAAPIHQTGDTQLVVYDFENNFVYLSYSDPVTKTKAFARPLIKLDMGELLAFENIF